MRSTLAFIEKVEWECRKLHEKKIGLEQQRKHRRNLKDYKIPLAALYYNGFTGRRKIQAELEQKSRGVDVF